MAQALTALEHPLRTPQFRRFWTGLTVSFLGDQFYFVALPWVVVQLTDSALAMGTILAAGAIPRLALILVGGTFSDRFAPRKILITSTTLRGVLVAAVGALLSAHSLRLWELYLLAVSFGAADAFSIPAGQAYLPSLLNEEQLLQANSVLETTIGVVTVAGPAPAAAAVTLLGMASAFLFDALSFLGLSAAMWTLPDPPRHAHKTKASMWRSIAEGIRYLRTDEVLYSLALLGAVVNLCMEGPLTVGLPYLASTRFHSPAAFAALLSSLAGGRMLGALLAGAGHTSRKGLLVMSGSALNGLCLASIGLFAPLFLVCGIVIVLGASGGYVDVHALSWVQQRVAPDLRGRVVSLLMFLSIGLAPVSMALAGLLAQRSLNLMFLLAGLILFAIVAASTPVLRKL
ncbi:MAG TPA: MFS transporter [Bryobacteraceae bacterium]|jgi:MFS family permease|nr:MFS transporter [Bryobacteraceae bacterium]